jgi:hypothetical protein
MICIPASDEEFFGWIEANMESFVVNSDKAKARADLPMLHHANCTHIYDRNWPGYTGGRFSFARQVDKSLRNGSSSMT